VGSDERSRRQGEDDNLGDHGCRYGMIVDKDGKLEAKVTMPRLYRGLGAEERVYEQKGTALRRREDW